MLRDRGRKVITMCHYNRPEYSRLVLESLRDCEGIENYIILPHVEPGCDDVRALFEAVDFAECIPTFNAERFGVNLNTEVALADGFERGDFVIHLEDDILCARDALRYYEWTCDRFEKDEHVFSVTGYHRRDVPAAPDDFHRVGRLPWFHPWGWGTWRDRWERFRGTLAVQRWDWDRQITEAFFNGNQPPRCVEVYPVLSRSQNIGLLSSMHHNSPEWYRQNHHLERWAGDYELPGGSFHEGPDTQESEPAGLI